MGATWKSWGFLAAAAAALAVIAGASAVFTSSAAPQAPAIRSAYERPSSTPFPAGNPYSEAKAELGRLLFFDPRVSGAENMSCATCHNPGLGWTDGLPKAIGAGARKLERHSPTILNLAWASR